MKKKWWLLAGIFVILVLVTLGLIGFFRTLAAYHDLRSAKDLLFAAKDSLENRNISQASDQFVQAQDRIKSAGAELKNGFTVGILRVVPYAGTQIRALDDFVRVGSHPSQAGILLTGAASGIPGLDAGSGVAKPGIGGMVDLLSQLQSPGHAYEAFRDVRPRTSQQEACLTA